MEIRYPNYYKTFHCIAGACPDTCCAGWEIPVDRASERRYLAAGKQLRNRAFARKLKKYVRDGRIVSEDVTCPFLNRDGLCEMYLEMGPESLCHTCARHPRHVEDYGNLHEVVLLLSCPEVARLVLEDQNGGYHTRLIPEKTGNMDGIDERWLHQLLEIRDCIWETAGESGGESRSFPVRMGLMLALVHDVQRRMKLGAADEIETVLKRYRKPGAEKRFSEQWNRKRRETKPTSHDHTPERYFLMSDFMEGLAGLETVCRSWPDLLENCRTMLYHSRDSREQYAGRRAVFTDEARGGRDLERVFEYFVYSFFLSALYDEDALTKLKMAVLCTMAMEELYLAADHLELSDRIEICHALARQIENDDENRAVLERMLKKEPFGAARIIDALLE